MVPSPEIQALIDRGALFLLNHSAGKDSQAMTIKLREIVPASQLVIVHAELPGADWPGLREHIETNSPGLPVHYCRANKTFLEMVKGRWEKITAAGTDASPWPSPKYRQCTSDLKRGPLEKLMRQIAKERGAKLIVVCEGLRAQESAARAKHQSFKPHVAMSKAGREAYLWLPIHGMLIDEVFTSIADAGQEPHWAYGQGMLRLSCVNCIFASEEQIRRAAVLMPGTHAEYVAMERLTGKSMMMPRAGKPSFLADVVAAGAA